MMNLRPDGPATTCDPPPAAPPGPPSVLTRNERRSVVANAARPVTETGGGPVGKLLDVSTPYGR